MNIYFLVEGKHTERKVYPKWLLHLIPQLSQVKTPTQVNNNNFVVFSGFGFPSLLGTHLNNAIKDINENGTFNYLVICLDADEDTVDNRRNVVLDKIKDQKLILNTSQLVIIVQNRCFETWFLGNRAVYDEQPQSEVLNKYNRFYNVQKDDPELMPAMDDFNTSAQFHAVYLKEMLSEKKIQYTKKYPNGVVEKHYLEELISRQSDTGHLKSFKDFIDFCERVNSEIE